MSAEEFVIWLQGFAEATANEYTITPKQWQDVKDKLGVVEIGQYMVDEDDAELSDELSYGDWCVSTTYSGSTDIFYYNNT